MTTILKCLEDIAECCKAPGNNSQILVSSTSSVHWSHPGSCSWSLPRGVGGIGGACVVVQGEGEGWESLHQWFSTEDDFVPEAFGNAKKYF